ncbi:chymotrypsin BI [Nilaparvata lugens]|uniref:chymotrypsin BI n=1 Tax=Nilaparvata lugens TaxID=108931 RepID=UPI00193CDA77|nr:chymotrypsin BI [Nilaparvata lugens]
MRDIFTWLFLSMNIFYLAQAKLTDIDGFLVDLEKLEPPLSVPNTRRLLVKSGIFENPVGGPNSGVGRWLNYFKPNVSSIIQGQDATSQSQFPYQAALFLKRKNEQTHSSFCGGSLISRSLILTAAHCLDNIEEVEVCLGCMHFNNDHEKRRKAFLVKKSSMIIHESWDPMNLKNDIALLILPTTAPLTDGVIKPLKLPKLGSMFEGVEGTVSGWGKTKSKASGISKKLKYISTAILDQKKCKDFYKETSNYTIEKHQLCTDGSKGKSTCQGDSGGPLVIKEGNEYTQIGIVSFGLRDCETKWPSVYTRVNVFLPWIQKIMKSLYRDNKINNN